MRLYICVLFVSLAFLSSISKTFSSQFLKGHRSFAARASTSIESNKNEVNLQQLVQDFLKKVGDILSGNDPFNFGSTSTLLNSYGTLFNCSGNNLIISGVGTMNIKNSSIVQNKPNIDLFLSLGFDYLTVTGDYFLDMDSLTMLKLYGNGQFGLKISDMNLNITGSIAPQNGILEFSDFSLTFNVAQFLVDIKNILNRPAMGTLASKILNDVGPSAINHDEQLKRLVSNMIKSSINNYAQNHGVTMEFVIEFMQKFIQ